VGKLRHNFTLDSDTTDILKQVDNKSEFVEDAVKAFSKKELYPRNEIKEIPKLKNVRITN
jgi:hypothetical protein